MKKEHDKAIMREEARMQVKETDVNSKL